MTSSTQNNNRRSPWFRDRWFVFALLVLSVHGLVLWRYTQPRQPGSPIAEKPALGEPQLRFEAGSSYVASQTPITVEFPKDMVAPENVGVTQPNDLLMIVPKVNGSLRWVDSHTVQFVPGASWPECQLFTVTLANHHRSLDGQPVASWSSTFTSQPPALEKVHVTNLEDKGDTLRLDFLWNHPPQPRSFFQKLTLEDSEGKKISFTPQRWYNTGRHLHITVPNMVKGKFRVRCEAGVVAENGPLESQKDAVFDLEFSPHLTISMSSKVPSSGEPYVVIDTNSQVEMESLKPFVSIKPPVDFRVELSKEDYWRGDAIVLRGNFTPGATYEVEFKDGLSSLSGLTMKSPSRTSVPFPNLPPSIRLPTGGRYLAIHGPKVIPIEAVNVSGIELSLRKVYANNLPYLAMQGLSYAITDRSYGRSWWDDHTSSNERHLMGPAKKLTIPVSLLPNVVQTFPVDLEKLAGEPLTGAWEVEINAQEKLFSRALFFVSDVGLSARVGSDAVWVWAMGLTDAKPKAGVEVHLFSNANAPLGVGKTDEFGVVKFPLTLLGEGERPSALLADDKGDLTMMQLASTQLKIAAKEESGVPYLKEGYEAHLWTSRGLFRPGEAIEVAAVLRGPALECPGVMPVTLHCTGPDGRKRWQGSGMLDAVGSVDFTIPMLDAWPTGKYTLELKAPGNDTPIGKQEVFVEDFLPATISLVTTAPYEDGYWTGRHSLPVKVAARYLYGAPAGNITVSARSFWKPEPFTHKAWEGMTFHDAAQSISPTGTSPISTFTKPDGTAVFYIPLPSTHQDMRMRATVTVSANDPSGRAVSNHAHISYDPFPFYIGLRPATPPAAARVNEPFDVDIAAVQPDGTIFSEGASASWVLESVVTTWSWRQTTSEQYAYESVETFATVTKGTTELVTGVGSIRLMPPSPGNYRLRATTDFHEARSSVRFRVFAPGEGHLAAATTPPDRVKIDIDKTRYLPGEEAVLSVSAPFPGTAWITLETDRVLSMWSQSFTGNTFQVSFPVPGDAGPNVYCGISMIRPAVQQKTPGAHRAIGYVSLPISRPEKRMDIALTAPPFALPQSELEVEINLPPGTPPGTRVWVAAVDQGICQLTQYTLPDTLDWLMRKRRLGTSAHDMYSQLLALGGGANGQNSAHGGDGDFGFSNRLNPVKGRRYEPMARWFKDIAVNEDGRATVRIPIPEFTGKLRLMAWTAGKDQLGSAEHFVDVRRDVVVQPSLPRFTAPGDQAHASMRVHNVSSKARELRWKIEHGGPVLIEPSSGVLHLPAGAERMIEPSLNTLDAVGLAWARFEVEGDGIAYSERIEWPVRPAAPLTRTFLTGLVRPGEQYTLPDVDGFLEGTFERNVHISGWPWMRLNGALEDLIRYPYGCLEQTVSTAFPMVWLSELLDQVQPGSGRRDELRRYVQTGINRVAAMQQPHGGFGWWPRLDEVNDYGTCYAGHFLLEAKKAGYNVPDWVINGLIEDLKRRTVVLNGDKPNWTLDAYALWVLALAEKPERGLLLRAWEQREKMSYVARLFLANAMAASGDRQRALQLLEMPVDPANSANMEDMLDSYVRRYSLNMLARMECGASVDELLPLARTLLDTQTDNRWATTHENGMGLLALGRLSRMAPHTDNVIAGHLNTTSERHAISSSIQKVIPTGKAEIVNEGETPLFYFVTSSGVPLLPAPEVHKECTINRTLLNESGNPADPEQLRQGDLLVVRLELLNRSPHKDHFVIEDLLPAGLEVESIRMNGMAHLAWFNAIKEQEMKVRHIEVRDDRVLVFPHEIQDKGTLHYLVRAVTPGTYIWPGISTEAMYAPSVHSREEATRIIVLPMIPPVETAVAP